MITRRTFIKQFGKLTGVLCVAPAMGLECLESFVKPKANPFGYVSLADQEVFDSAVAKIWAKKWWKEAKEDTFFNKPGFISDNPDGAVIVETYRTKP